MAITDKKLLALTDYLIRVVTRELEAKRKCRKGGRRGR
jgi:hypothetical protein